jgi:hypothetical protein
MRGDVNPVILELRMLFTLPVSDDNGENYNPIGNGWMFQGILDRDEDTPLFANYTGFLRDIETAVTLSSIHLSKNTSLNR